MICVSVDNSDGLFVNVNIYLRGYIWMGVKNNLLDLQRVDNLMRWYWIIPILIIVSYLAIRQIDYYSPTPDEFYSMYNSGGIINGPFSPGEILQSIRDTSPQHTLGYFLMLSVWGNMVSWDIAIVRVLSIFWGLLSIAMIYRLARDVINPVAGFYAAAIMASFTFYNFYVPFTRMYTLIVFLSALILWIYIRMLYRQQASPKRDYVALFVTTYLLLNMHIFCTIFFIALGIYHLLFAPKNRTWWGISIAVSLGVLVFLPYLVIIVTGIPYVESYQTDIAINAIQYIRVWLTILFNDQILWAFVVAIGLLTGIRQRTITQYPFVLISLLYVLIIALIAQMSFLIIESGMRYLLASLPSFLLLIVLGFVYLYSWRRWTILLLPIWIVSAVYFQNTTSWKPYLSERNFAFTRLPIHRISRMALNEPYPPLIITNTEDSVLDYDHNLKMTQRQYYLKQHGLVHIADTDLSAVSDKFEANAIAVPIIWVYYQNNSSIETPVVSPTELEELGYELCKTIDLPPETRLEQYYWQSFNCSSPAKQTFESQDVLYQLYATRIDRENMKLYIADSWQLQTDIDMSQYNVSYQILNSQNEKFAQLDLPLEYEPEQRQLYINLSDIPSGSYRLVCIVYHKTTHDKLQWFQNGDDIGDWVNLTDVVLP